MADKTKIEWCDATWNVITGCSVTSPACTNCYAMRLAGTRLREHSSRKGLTKIVNGKPVWTGEARFNEEWLTQPLKWKRPRKIFVCAHADLFHPSVPDEWIDKIFAVMALAPQHTFFVLTKRAERMREYLSRPTVSVNVGLEALGLVLENPKMYISGGVIIKATDINPGALKVWPLPNVVLMITAEDQKRADERIPHLIATPAAKRGVIIEPMLGPVDLRRWLATANVTCKKCGTQFWLHEADPCKHAGGGGWTLACPNCGDCKCVPSQDERGDPVTWSPPTSWKPKEVGRFDCVHPTISVKSGLDLVICGGESGPDARPMHPDWPRSLRDQCKAAGVPFMFKQWGEWAPDMPHLRDDDGSIKTLPGISWHNANVFRVGKSRAGRLLDGEEHNGDA